MTAFALSAEKPKPEELLQAVQLHDMVAINRLLAQGADVNAPNDAGATPLM